ncbi:Guanylate-binding family protein, partial [Striga hermonthica]
PPAISSDDTTALLLHRAATLFSGETGGSGGESPHTASPSTPLHVSASNVSVGPARPIRFVYADEKGRFHMDPEAVALFQLVKQPVGMVSVCGRARQGKSFILNQVNLGKGAG